MGCSTRNNTVVRAFGVEIPTNIMHRDKATIVNSASQHYFAERVGDRDKAIMVA